MYPACLHLKLSTCFIENIFLKCLTFKVFLLNVRIYEQVEGEVIWEDSILDLYTHRHTQSHVSITLTITIIPPIM